MNELDIMLDDPEEVLRSVCVDSRAEFIRDLTLALKRKACREVLVDRGFHVQKGNITWAKAAARRAGYTMVIKDGYVKGIRRWKA
jgi:hypothetical protein